MESFRKAYGALKDSTTVNLAKVNSDFKDVDIAIVKATNHVESPPKGRHIRKIFFATSSSRPRADVAYCIHGLARRLEKTRNWIVAIKTLIVIHRTLREGDPTFRDELVNYSRRDHVFQISNFKDDSSSISWDCSAWVRSYAKYLEERLHCYRTLKYDIEAETMTQVSSNGTKVHHRTRLLSINELLEQLPSLQRLLSCLVSCQPEGAACHTFLIQYALALVLKESFKIYCAINDGIINLVDMFFDMSKSHATKALDIYRKAGQQADSLARFYDFCRNLELARTFQFPMLKQPPPSFLATMEEYIREAPHIASVSNRRLEYKEANEEPEETEGMAYEELEKQVEEPESEEEHEEEPEPDPEPESEPEIVEEVTAVIAADEPVDFLGLYEVNPKAQEIEDSNALALAIIQPGNESSNNNQLMEIGKTPGWELALVTAPSNSTKSQTADIKMAGGFNNLLLDSLYEDEAARRQLQLQNAGYGSTSGYEMSAPNPFNNQHDPFAMSNNIAPPANVQMALMAQQQQQQQQQMMMQQQQMMQQPYNMMMVPHQYSAQPNMMTMNTSAANPFGDPFSYPQSPLPSHGNHTLL